MICEACRAQFHSLCRGCPCQHRRPPLDPRWELARDARQKVQDGEQMTVDQAQAWLDRNSTGLCACVGGKACCRNVADAARAVLREHGLLPSEAVGGDTHGPDAG